MLAQLIGLSPALPAPRPSIDLQVAVQEACKFKVPAHTASKIQLSQLGPIKEYLHSLALDTYVTTETRRLFDLGADPSQALTGRTLAAYLKTNLPSSEYELTPMGLRKVVEPSKTEDIKFLWKCRVAENPWYVLNLFATHQLTGQDMKCMYALYPHEYNALTSAFLAYILKSYAADVAIPRPLRLMLAIFFQMPTLKLEQLSAYKTADIAPKPTPANTKAPNISQLETK